MSNIVEFPWMKIHEVLLDAGYIRDWKKFCIEVIKKIYCLIPYDQARIYFINDNGKIFDEVLFGVDKRWSEAYLEYYSQIENGSYSILSRAKGNCFLFPKFKGSVYDWTVFEYDEFIVDYIRPQGIHYSLGFTLHSADNLPKSVLSLDRINQNGYTCKEIDIMNIVQPHLDNLHKNLFVLTLTNLNYVNKTKTEILLTKREFEIAELLSKGIIPANIGKKLYLSLSTVYRHIANIHEKLNVSNRQELILKFINDYNKV